MLAALEQMGATVHDYEMDLMPDSLLRARLRKEERRYRALMEQ